MSKNFQQLIRVTGYRPREEIEGSLDVKGSSGVSAFFHIASCNKAFFPYANFISLRNIVRLALLIPKPTVLRLAVTETKEFTSTTKILLVSSLKLM